MALGFVSEKFYPRSQKKFDGVGVSCVQKMLWEQGFNVTKSKPAGFSSTTRFI
jgi:hypothetical protein